MPTRREVLALGAAAFAFAGLHADAAAAPRILVHKSPSCGCCKLWVDHLTAGGFPVQVVEAADLDAVRTRLGVPRSLAACHTAVVQGYVVEGHVPVVSIRRMLAEAPLARGIAVAGMPIGSPGMEGPNPEPFAVQLFDERGRVQPYQSFRPPHRW